MCKHIPFDHKTNTLLHCIVKVQILHADASWTKTVLRKFFLDWNAGYFDLTLNNFLTAMPSPKEATHHFPLSMWDLLNMYCMLLLKSE